jgi:hypothetical protein
MGKTIFPEIPKRNNRMADLTMPISKFEIHWVGGETTVHFVPTSDLAQLVEATVRLHHSPGINPHSGKETRTLWKIVTYRMEIAGPHWWSTPDLGINGNTGGARIVNWLVDDIAFVDTKSADYLREVAESQHIDFEECH